MKTAFVLGHTSGTGFEEDKGQYSPFLDETEWYWYAQFKDELKKMGDVFTHDANVTSYSKRQKLTAAKTKDYDLVIELHFNSFHKSSAHGCECWHSATNELTEQVSKEFCRLMSQEYKLRNRGNKAMRRGQNGSKFIFTQKPHAILIEPFFGSNKGDCEKILKCPQNLFTEVLPKTIEYFEKLKNEN